jgi:hypothetical protein
MFCRINQRAMMTAGSLVALEEALRGHDLIEERGRGGDRVGFGLSTFERSLHELEVVVIGAGRNFVGLSYGLVAGDDLVEGRVSHRSRR